MKYLIMILLMLFAPKVNGQNAIIPLKKYRVYNGYVMLKYACPNRCVDVRFNDFSFLGFGYSKSVIITYNLFFDKYGNKVVESDTLTNSDRWILRCNKCGGTFSESQIISCADSINTHIVDSLRTISK